MPVPPKLPDERRRRNVPSAGEWTAAPGVGWQHGKTPACPPKLTKPAQDAWRLWLGSWMASFWQADDLPMLRRLVLLYDECERGEATVAAQAEMRQLTDKFGLNPRARQQLRWLPPVEGEAAKATGKKSQRYGHLKAV